MNGDSYCYLNKLLDVIFKVHYQYNIPYEVQVKEFKSNAGNQAELKGTFFYPLKDRIELHKVYLCKLFKQRNKIGTKQLKLW